MYRLKPSVKRLAWITGLLVLAVVVAVVGLVQVVQADATSTSFDPTTVALIDIGDSAIITVETVDVDPAVSGVQLNIQHSDDVTITSPDCGGYLRQGQSTSGHSTSRGRR